MNAKYKISIAGLGVVKVVFNFREIHVAQSIYQGFPRFN
jgi:hypothetical protein